MSSKGNKSKKAKKKVVIKSELDTMECHYCHDPFKEPKILCCTRMCKECLQNYIETTVKDDFISCRVCYIPIKIPDPYRPREEWSSQYKTDIFLKRMQAAADQVAKEHNCFVCESNRGETTAAAQYCFNCDTYYCTTCNELHLQLRGLQGHVIVAINKLTAKDLMTKRTLYCDTHKDKLMDTYCSHDGGEVVCSTCANENHKDCKTELVSSAIRDVTEKLNKVRGKLPAVIELQEQKHEVLRERTSRIGKQNEQKVAEIEDAFSRIQAAVDERKATLLQQAKATANKNNVGLGAVTDKTAIYMSTMKDLRTYVTWLDECGSDFDVASSGETIVEQYDHLYEKSREPEVNDTSGFRDNFHIEETVVNTFIQLVNMIGTDAEGHIIAFKTKQVPLRMPEDLHEPVIKDILLLEDGQLVATDNKNKCVKMSGVSPAGDPRTVRLDLRTDPWGIAKLQINVMAITGHQCIYIITKTEELHLQSTVRTRQDYFAVAALNPINLALTCKFPPCVDIVDITGRKLRTLDMDPQGVPFFKIPQYLSVLYDKILVTDRDNKSLSCLDQHGSSIFTFGGSHKEQLANPKGVCASASGRIFLVEKEDLWLLSSSGKMLNKIITNTPGIGAVTEENGTLCISVDGKGVFYYKIIDMSASA